MVGWAVQGASGGNGGDSSLTNSISGGAATTFHSFTNSHRRRRRAHGGIRAEQAGLPGMRSSSLTFTNSLGGDVFGTSAAIGGEVVEVAELSEATGADGGTAHCTNRSHFGRSGFCDGYPLLAARWRRHQRFGRAAMARMHRWIPALSMLPLPAETLFH